MRAASAPTTSSNQSPLLRLVAPPALEMRQREGYAVAESIMRSAARAKRAEMSSASGAPVLRRPHAG